MDTYINPTDESASAMFSSNIQGPVVMLNLLRFRVIADYSSHPHLAPGTPISGHDAYQIYMAHTLPFLEQADGQVLFSGEGGSYFIGPKTEKWDLVMISESKFHR